MLRELVPILGNSKFRYLDIVEAIADGIRSGRLRSGQRLPVQRELAAQLGLSIGTVSRAYAEAERRGLVVGKVGRGTYVSGLGSTRPARAAAPDESRPIDLMTNRLSAPGAYAPYVPRLEAAIRTLFDHPDLSGVLALEPDAPRLEHRAAGAAWLGRTGLQVMPEQVVICSGLQHGLSVIFAALARAGDLAVTEELCYPGTRLLDRIFGISLQGLPIDRHGLCPDALEEACRQGNVRFLVFTPTVHNPTNSVMPVERRREIAEIARRHDLVIIECANTEIFPADPSVPPVSSLVPERSFYIASAWRSTGICLGYMAAPAPFVDKVNRAVQAITWTISPLLMQIVSTWIDNGTAAEIAEWHRRETLARQEIARRVLHGLHFDCHPSNPNIWLHLPAPWRCEDFVEQVARRQVLVTSAEVFAVRRAVVPHAVRISLGGVRDHALVERGLEVVVEVATERPSPGRVVV